MGLPEAGGNIPTTSSPPCDLTKFWVTDITDPPVTEARVVGIREMLANSAQARPFSRNGRQLVAREPTNAKIVDRLAHMYQGV